MKSTTILLIALALTAAADDSEQPALHRDGLKSYAAPLDAHPGFVRP